MLDEKFRKDLRSEVQSRQKKYKKAGFDKLLPDGRSKPVPSEFTVVYGVMRSRNKRSATLGLPFFSKISLRAIAERIELMGYKVEVHLIEKIEEKKIKENGGQSCLKIPKENGQGVRQLSWRTYSILTAKSFCAKYLM